MAFSILAVKGLALETGMLRIDLPFMQAWASNAGPAATNSGFFVNGSICFSKYDRSSACAETVAAPHIAKFKAMARQTHERSAISSLRWKSRLIAGDRNGEAPQHRGQSKRHAGAHSEGRQVFCRGSRNWPTAATSGC